MGGVITMTDSERKERRDQVERFRVLQRETTEPLAALLLHDIVLELEAESKGDPSTLDSPRKQRRRVTVLKSD
jgi:hypothetical protein